MNKLAKLLFLPCVILTIVTPTIYLTSCKSYPQYIKKFKVEVEKEVHQIKTIYFYITYDCNISRLNNSTEGISGPKCLLAYVPKFNQNLIGWSEFDGLIEAITIDGSIYHSILCGYIYYDYGYATKIKEFIIKDVIQYEFITINS